VGEFFPPPLTFSLNIIMSICFLNDKPYAINLAPTPMVKKWIESYAGKTFQIKKQIDASVCNRLKKILQKHDTLFKKFNLYFDNNSLWQIETLANIHVQIVELQKLHKKSTDLLNKNTDGDWDLLHDLIHKQESLVKNRCMEFGLDNSEVIHNSGSQTENWSWESRLTQQQYHESASFERWHINLPTSELGRHPYECFTYSPNTWQREGSLLGQISRRLEVQLEYKQGRPDAGYEEWCKAQDLPIIGNNFPLAKFVDDPTHILQAKTLRIENE
jgi:hypothetical protein